MRNRAILLTTAAVITLLLLSPAARANEEAEKEAVAAAETWLALIDRGDIARSWETAAVLFKRAASKEQWVQIAGAVREPLGKLISRKVSSSEYTSSLPGVPDGEYVVIRFTTVFENKASAVETLTTVRDPDGVWRVCGYFIK